MLTTLLVKLLGIIIQSFLWGDNYHNYHNDWFVTRFIHSVFPLNDTPWPKVLATYTSLCREAFLTTISVKHLNYSPKDETLTLLLETQKGFLQCKVVAYISPGSSIWLPSTCMFLDMGPLRKRNQKLWLCSRWCWRMPLGLFPWISPFRQGKTCWKLQLLSAHWCTTDCFQVKQKYARDKFWTNLDI